VRASWTLVVVAVALAVVAVPPLAGAGPKKRGKIVRIERTRNAARGTARVCRLLDVNMAICWGKPPVRGESAALLSPGTNGREGNRGKVTINEVTEEDACSTSRNWRATLDTSGADMVDLETWQTWVVLDVDLGPSARVTELSADGPEMSTYETSMLAIDRGRHGSASPPDFVVGVYSCDQDGQSNPSGATNGYCMQYYASDGGHWTQLRKDVVVPDGTCP
jgi:hypothetical protein